MKLIYKLCSLNEIDELMLISKRTFVEAFEKHNDPLDFNEYINKAFSHSALIGELENENSQFYFVYHNEILVAYFKLNQGSAQTDVKSEDSIELERIYVLSNFQGKRLGEEILNHIKAIGQQVNKKSLWLGVWEENIRAIQFYERQGFQKFGTHPYIIGTDEQTDWLMGFDLSTL